MKRLLPFILGLLLCTCAAAGSRSVVIPVEFDDLKLSCSREQIQEMVDSAAAYLSRQLHGAREFSFEMAGTVCLSRPYAYYGANSTDRKDARIPEAVIEACRLTDPDYDFSETDNVILVTAGRSEAYGGGENAFWPTQSTLSEFNLHPILDGRVLDSFGICPELDGEGHPSGHGDFCHEYGHFLGLKDLYDTDGAGSGGESRVGLGELSLMASGNRNEGGHNPAPLCAADYDQLQGFRGTRPGKGTFTLEPVGVNAAYAVLPSTVRNRYYLLENRDGTLLVTLIDRSDSFAGFSDRMRRNLSAAERWQLNEINCNPAYQCADLLWKGSEGTFAGDSLAVSGIRACGASLSFEIFEPVVVKNIKLYQDGISIDWSSELDAARIASSGIAWWTGQEKLSDRDACRLSDGSFHYTIDGLAPGTKYQLSIHVSTSDGLSFNRVLDVVTLPRRDNAPPFIMLDGADRNSDGSFRPGARLPLRLRNAADAAEVEWTFDGKRISIEADGLWTIPSSGKLQARIIRNDGSEELIVKKINVR